MRRIHLTEEVTLRFPERSEEFDEGVELGILAASIEFGRADRVWIAATSCEQARALAEKMGYRVTEGPTDGDWVEIALRPEGRRPRFRLVRPE
jgi:ApbE superfamily uncharacterized protein (UPF0280 family)